MLCLFYFGQYLNKTNKYKQSEVVVHKLYNHDFICPAHLGIDFSQCGPWAKISLTPLTPCVVVRRDQNLNYWAKPLHAVCGERKMLPVTQRRHTQGNYTTKSDKMDGAMYCATFRDSLLTSARRPTATLLELRSLLYRYDRTRPSAQRSCPPPPNQELSHTEPSTLFLTPPQSQNSCTSCAQFMLLHVT